MENEPLRMGFGLDVRLFSVCAHHHRDRKPSRKGFFLRAVLAALAVDPIRVAAKKTDTA
jgi:hypothetical protein